MYVKRLIITIIRSAALHIESQCEMHKHGISCIKIPAGYKTRVWSSCSNTTVLSNQSFRTSNNTVASIQVYTNL